MTERAFAKALDIMVEFDAQLLQLRDTVNIINDSSPYPRFIDQLNEDILRIIFGIATRASVAEEAPNDIPEEEREPEGEEEKLKAPLVIKDFPQVTAGVSRRWRAVARGTPELWTHLRIDVDHPPKWTAQCVLLSRDSPLHVQWSMSNPWHDHQCRSSLMKYYDLEQEWAEKQNPIILAHSRALQPHLSRVAGLTVDNMSEYVETSFKTTFLYPVFCSGRLQSLKSSRTLVDADLHSDNGSHRDLPRLRSLDVWYWDTLHQWPLQQLRVLRVHYIFHSEWQPVRSALELCTGLEELALTWAHYPKRGNELPDEEGLVRRLPEFTALRSLHLWCIPDSLTRRLMDAIKAPHLTSLAFGFQFLIELPLAEFIQPSLPTLEHLVLSTDYFPTREFLSLLDTPPPSLKTLALEGRKSYDPRAGVPKDVFSAINKCKKLSLLTLKGVMYDYTGLVGMFDARIRQQQGDAYTSSVELIDVPADEEAIMPRDVRPRFMQLGVRFSCLEPDLM